ncbi:MAG: YfiR family protein [Bacteroidota bacterium]
MKKIFFILLILNLLFSRTSFAQEIPVPVMNQLQIFYKIFSSNRNFKLKEGNAIEICIVYQKKFRLSSGIKNQVLSIIEENGSFKKFDNKKINFSILSIENEKTLDNYLESNKVDIILITPLRAVNIELLAETTRKHKVLSFCFVPEYVESGLSVGIGSKAGKPKILINLKASREEGADFSSQLLKLSKIIN